MTIEAQIHELEEERYRAMLQADVPALEALLADEMLYAHSDGARDTKRSYLEKLASGFFDYVEIRRPEETIVIAGATAIVAGRMAGHVRVGGQDRHLDNSSLAVWALRDGRWQLLAYQPTVLPKS